MAGAGRAWWHIDMLELQTARLSGAFNELSRAVPPGLAAARDALSSALASLSEQHGMRPERLVLGGFSQGAMLACDYAIRSAHPLLGLVQLSGTTLCADDWQRLLPARRGLRVLQSHSPDDLVLPMVLAERLQEWMVTAGLAHEFVSFRGGHGISQQVLRHLRAFVASLV
jgi:phospholipase/carboxylesterase